MYDTSQNRIYNKLTGEQRKELKRDQKKASVNAGCGFSNHGFDPILMELPLEDEVMDPRERDWIE